MDIKILFPKQKLFLSLLSWQEESLGPEVAEEVVSEAASEAVSEVDAAEEEAATEKKEEATLTKEVEDLIEIN